MYKLIKNKTEKKHEDPIEIYPNNEIDNLPDLEKNQDSIGKIDMYNEHCLMEQDFIQVNEDTIYVRSKNNIEIDQQLLPEYEPIPIKYSMEHNVLNTVDDGSNFNTATENRNFHLEENTYNLIPAENNFDIPNTIDQPSKETFKVTPFNKKKILQISPIDSCLIWPKTPERKGKRNSERVPFVLSSKMWQSMYEQKEAVKKNIEDEKENNRKKRLENKLTKSLKTNLKSVSKRGINKPAIVRNIFKNNNLKKKIETVTSGSLSNEVISIFTPSDLDNDDSSSSNFYKTEGNCLK